MENNKFLDIIKIYIEGSKTFVQLSSAGLLIPLVLRNDVVKLFGKVDKFSRTELTFICVAWLFFLVAIGAGALYQYAAVKFAEYEIDPESTFVPRPLKHLVHVRGPGVAYGVMVVSFYLGAISTVIYTFSIMIR